MIFYPLASPVFSFNTIGNSNNLALYDIFRLWEDEAYRMLVRGSAGPSLGNILPIRRPHSLKVPTPSGNTEAVRMTPLRPPHTPEIQQPLQNYEHSLQGLVQERDRVEQNRRKYTALFITMCDAELAARPMTAEMHTSFLAMADHLFDERGHAAAFRWLMTHVPEDDDGSAHVRVVEHLQKTPVAYRQQLTATLRPHLSATALLKLRAYTVGPQRYAAEFFSLTKNLARMQAMTPELHSQLLAMSAHLENVDHHVEALRFLLRTVPPNAADAAHMAVARHAGKLPQELRLAVFNAIVPQLTADALHVVWRRSADFTALTTQEAAYTAILNRVSADHATPLFHDLWNATSAFPDAYSRTTARLLLGSRLGSFL